MTALTLSDAKLHLNIPLTDSDNDAALSSTIEAAEAAIGAECGPLQAVEVTERVRGGRRLVLRRTPVVSLTSVTPSGGSALSLTGVYVNESAGVVELDDGVFSADRYTVVYQAGRATVPADLLQAVKELVRHMWASQRGAQPPYAGAMPNDDGDVMLADGALGFTFPRRVEQLMEPHRQVAV